MNASLENDPKEKVIHIVKNIIAITENGKTHYLKIRFEFQIKNNF